MQLHTWREKRCENWATGRCGETELRPTTRCWRGTETPTFECQSLRHTERRCPLNEGFAQRDIQSLLHSTTAFGFNKKRLEHITNIVWVGAADLVRYQRKRSNHVKDLRQVFELAFPGYSMSSMVLSPKDIKPSISESILRIMVFPSYKRRVTRDEIRDMFYIGFYPPSAYKSSSGTLSAQAGSLAYGTLIKSIPFMDFIVGNSN